MLFILIAVAIGATLGGLSAARQQSAPLDIAHRAAIFGLAFAVIAIFGVALASRF